MDREAYCALLAQLVPGITAGTLRQLLAESGSYFNLFEGSCNARVKPAVQPQLQLLRSSFSNENSIFRNEADRILEQLSAIEASVVPITSDDYPPLLREIASPPPLLFVRGSIANLHLPQIAVVGSRRMTRSGRQLAGEWSKALAASGFAVTSGLAMGIDAAAHEGALLAETGKTIAVMATGIDRIYPRRHQQLADRILSAGGTLVSEMLPGALPLPAFFPRRNRIISGLSLGVLVVEAALRSGSLITARCALEQNREVFAIPGSIHNPLSRGCHSLIKQGALLVESVQEIVEQLGGSLAGMADSGVPIDGDDDLTDDEREILKLVGFDPVDIDRLDEMSGQQSPDIAGLLVSLEIKGLIENINGYYQRTR